MDGLGPRILEVNPRIGAACVADSIETFTDVKTDATRAALIVGRKVKAPRRRKAQRHAMVFLFTDRTGTLTKLTGLRKALNIPQVQVMRQIQGVGDKVGGDMEEGFVAGFWMTAKDEAEAKALYDRIRDIVDIQVS